MPNRILRDYTDSLKFDGISADAERTFVRLILQADDYGRFHAETRLVKAAAYPLEDQIRLNDVARWLEELSRRHLILQYEVQGRKLLALLNYRQRLKQSRAKFPAPDGKPGNWLPDDSEIPELAGSSRKFPSEVHSDVHSDLESESEARDTRAQEPSAGVETPSWAEVQAHSAVVGLPDWRARMWFDEMESVGWRWKGQRVLAWRNMLTTVRTWWEADGKPLTPPSRKGGAALTVAGGSREQAPAPKKLRAL